MCWGACAAAQLRAMGAQAGHGATLAMLCSCIAGQGMGSCRLPECCSCRGWIQLKGRAASCARQATSSHRREARTTSCGAASWAAASPLAWAGAGAAAGGTNAWCVLAGWAAVDWCDAYFLHTQQHRSEARCVGCCNAAQLHGRPGIREHVLVPAAAAQMQHGRHQALPSHAHL